MSFALDGIRVLELARFQAGPRGGLLLSDLGAEVIKIEPPGGEETRRMPPIVRGQSVYFTVYNRGKKSVCLDLRSAAGKDVFAKLVAKADVVLENFRPGVMRAMGFDFERLQELNPRIILVSVSGFGQYGPYRDRPAFDSLGQAMSGLMTLTGQAEGKPIGTASSVVDRYTALHATIGTLAALRHRDRTGEGQIVDVCLLDSALTMVEIPTSYHLATGAQGGEGGRPPYRARDGWVVISAAGREMASRLMQVARRGSSATDDTSTTGSFNATDDPSTTGSSRAPNDPSMTGSSRATNDPSITGSSTAADDTPKTASSDVTDDTPITGSSGGDQRRALIERWCAAHTVDEVCAALHAAGVPVAPVRSIPEVAQDPHLWEREMLVKMADPLAGEMYVPGVTIKLSKTPGRVGPVPTPGQHTDEILRDVLGLDAPALAVLRRDRAIA
jgi:crotonobetainyl-CoA:carnitine CoA-transferase CaiB-like acyl-CoA transferase